MKIFIYSALITTLCVAPALAQVNVEPRPMAPRPADVAGQIKQDLGDLANQVTQKGSFFFAYPYVYEARYGYFGASDWINELRYSLQDNKIQIESVQVLERNGNDARATVTYKIVPDATFGAQQRDLWNGTHQETVVLKLGANPFGGSHAVWRIVPPQTAPPALKTSEDIAKQNVLLANVAYHIAQKQLPEQIGTPAERSMRNLKQLGLGVFQFTQDYDEIYAFTPRYLIEALSPYSSDKTIFQVPDTNEIYTFNGNLSSLQTDEIKAPAQTVMFYEGQNETPIFRYDGKAAICFADGHVALVSPDEAKSLVWKP